MERRGEKKKYRGQGKNDDQGENEDVFGKRV